MISDKDLIQNKYGNIVLAGHNNKYVFSKLYKLELEDEIIISDFKNEYLYNVESLEYVNIKDRKVLDNVYNDAVNFLYGCEFVCNRDISMAISTAEKINDYNLKNIILSVINNFSDIENHWAESDR